MAKQGRSMDVGFGVFKEHETDWVFNRTLAFMQENAADIGDCLYTARRIDEQNGESWISEWEKLADRVNQQGKESLENEHYISARESFLRACNYYRTAEYGCVPSHPKFDKLWQSSVDCMIAAGTLFNPQIERIVVKYEDYELPGYFWRPDKKGDHPTLVVAGGNDSSLEEIIFWVGMAAVRRGYNLFTFEHPGHRGALHLYPDCVKNPEFEKPYEKAFDLLETLPGVDERIALKGYSFGGYVTCHVAAFEKRIKAIIPCPPIIDGYKLFTNDSKDSFILKILSDKMLNKLVEKAMDKSPMRKSLAKYTMWSFGTPDLTWSEFAKFETQKKFNCVNTLKYITCPTFAMLGKGEGEEMRRQSETFMNMISSKDKILYEFSKDSDSTNDHCQLDGLSRANQVMFDWLDETL